MLKIYNLIDKINYIHEVATLEYEEWADSPEQDKENRIVKKIEKIKSKLKEKDFCKLILLDENVLKGFISIFPSDCEECKNLTPWYATMYVKREFRGKGYSKILNDAILKEAKTRKYEQIFLKTDLNNYYEKFGAKFIKNLSNNEKLYKFELQENPTNTSDINQYYKNTQDSKPNKNVINFVNLEIKPKNAIELGCGAGRDTKYLIQNGWKVLAIDRENVLTILTQKLNNQEQKNFRFKKQKFENLELELTNLIVANFSLPFCNKNSFNKMWKTVQISILPNGYFVGNFFGVNDEWVKIKPEMIFLEKQQVLKL